MDRIFFSALFIILFVNNTIGQKANNKVGDTIYGDFNGDKKFEYAYRKLIKKGVGNPIEDGTPDVYEVCFSDVNIKPIKDDFYWFILINEGDLDNDGSDELSVREDPMNGCLGLVKTFTIKKEETYYLIEPFSFYRGACNNKISINPEDLVEKTNNAVYYYEYDANNSYVVNNIGKRIFGKKNKAFDLKVNRTEKETIKSDLKSNYDVLNSLKFDKDNNYSGHGTGKGMEESSLGKRKAIEKPTPEYNCKEQGKIIVEITVDKDGNVIKAYAGTKGTTNFSKCLLQASKEAALKTKFEPLLNENINQLGYLTYNFTIQN